MNSHCHKTFSSASLILRREASLWYFTVQIGTHFAFLSGYRLSWLTFFVAFVISQIEYRNYKWKKIATACFKVFPTHIVWFLDLIRHYLIQAYETETTHNNKYITRMTLCYVFTCLHLLIKTAPRERISLILIWKPGHSCHFTSYFSKCLTNTHQCDCRSNYWGGSYIKALQFKILTFRVVIGCMFEM